MSFSDPHHQQFHTIRPISNPTSLVLNSDVNSEPSPVTVMSRLQWWYNYQLEHVIVSLLDQLCGGALYLTSEGVLLYVEEDFIFQRSHLIVHS